jgi:hypothetical protein
MAEFLTQPPFPPDYPEALGPNVQMDERMRTALLQSQKGIHESINEFPYNLSTSRRNKMIEILGVKRWDLMEALELLYKWKVLKEVTISGNSAIVTNNALLDLAALAHFQSGAVSSDNQPQSYIAGLPLWALNDHVQMIVTETRRLLGTSLLAKGLLTPEPRSILRRNW